VFAVVRDELLSLMDREGIPVMDVTESTSLIGDLGLSSLAVLDLVVGIERALDFRFENVESWASADATDGREYCVGAIVDATLATVGAASVAGAA
jgi:acyl carrier protein